MHRSRTHIALVALLVLASCATTPSSPPPPPPPLVAAFRTYQRSVVVDGWLVADRTMVLNACAVSLARSEAGRAE